MKKKHKSGSINIFGITIFVRITYPEKRKSLQLNIPFSLIKQFAFVLFVLFLVWLFGLGVKTQVETTAYFTKNSPFLEKISPVLGKVEKKTTIVLSTEKERIVFHGSEKSKQIALTFDADMTPQMKGNLDLDYVKSYYDQNIISTLEKTNTKATLFLTGMWIEQYPFVAKQLASNPLFELGNHSYSHPSFDGECFGLTPSTDEQDKVEIEKTQRILLKITGTDNKLFRFPGGCYSPTDLDIAKRAGVIPIQWDAEGQDGFNPDREFIESNVLNNVKNGSIIVLHMNGFPNEPETANALPFIISTLKERGFAFVKVSELLTAGKIESKNFNDFINYTDGL